VSWSARQRWVVLGGLLTAALTAAAWLSEDESRDPPTPGANHWRADGVRSATPKQASQVNLEKLKPRKLEAPSRDPFAIPNARREAPKPVAAPPAPVSQPVAVTVPEPPSPPPPSAPPLPFTYMGKLVSAKDNAVFLISGDRNLVVREGDTIDSIYRVEKVTSNEITLVYLPLDQRQILGIGEAK
jgi:hypothetical protein